MSPPDRQRGNSHAVRPSASSRSSNIIAPPPRAQLTGTSSSSSSHGPDGDSTRESANPANKDGGATSATKGKETNLLKEKDDKIAVLEQELSVMENEFAQELDRLSQNESESTGLWQAKYASLNQQSLQTESELQALRAEVAARDAERVELREGLEMLRRDLNQRDDRIRYLKGHVAGLKQWVSTSTARGDQTSDEEFGDAMTKLGNGLQNWVIVHFRRAQLDFSQVNEAIIDDIRELVPMYEELAAPAKVHLLQCVVSAILVETIFDSYFVGLPKDQATQLAQTEKYLASLSSIEAVNQWRAMTLTMLQKEAPLKMQEETTSLTDSVIARVNRIVNTVTDAKETDSRNQALRALVNNAIDLARLLVVQKAVFKVNMPKLLPHQRILFEASTMDDIGGEDEDSLTAREICCVTFPGIIKTGDENGDHLHFTNVVSKARVLCSPE
ncbi:hypothetical protein F4779DRAFT_173788 [Xylariaceae sp. FL0662B]|nr:hypothetical protein F4779DRAFT_173788 [Xylariaceae sp. FL0662B]